MHLSLVRIYINTLFALARHGNTFAKEATQCIEELSAPEVVAGEFFKAIDDNPASPFESHLRQQARANYNQDK